MAPSEWTSSSIVNSIAAKLRQRRETIGFAESCSGGRVSAAFAAQAGVSDVFMGAVVAYSNRVKIDCLDVPESLLQSVGAVSRPVALAMARGLCKQLDVDWSVAVTGIAGPSGGSVEKPVGTVFFAVCGPGIGVTAQQLFDGDRIAIQAAAENFALKFLAQSLQIEFAD
jgi:PncC family amidohydrolase